MTILELTNELKRYNNDYTVSFKKMGEDDDRHSKVDFTNCPTDKELTLEFYG